MRSILLVPISPGPTDGLHTLERQLAELLHLPVVLHSEPSLDMSHAFDPSRNQYYSTEIISALLHRFPNHDGKILGVTAGDLFVPVLTYVFGEAQLDGRVALISAARLDERVYGLSANPRLLAHRLLKEAVHELGHTFGLVHCQGMDCVMRSSTVVEEIDMKSERFCPACAGLLLKQMEAPA